MEIRCNHLTGSSNPIQDAIDALPEEGGTVVIPRGEWYVGPLLLRSRMELRLEKGADVFFTRRREDCRPAIGASFHGKKYFVYRPMIYAGDCTDISITGAGCFHGNGKDWNVTENGTEEEPWLPSILVLDRCSRINLKDFSCIDSPGNAVLILGCSSIGIRGLRIREAAPSRGGSFIIDSSNHVLVSECTGAGGRTAVLLSSGTGLSRAIEIRRCVFDGGNVSVQMGFPKGTGFDDVWVHDCVLRNAGTGIRIGLPDSEKSILRNIRFESIQVISMAGDAVQITVNGSATPQPEGITLKNIIGSAEGKSLSLAGLPESILDKIFVRNVHVDAMAALRQV